MKIQGVPFFDTPEHCIAHFEALPLHKRMWSCLSSFLTSIKSYCSDKLSLQVHRFRKIQSAHSVVPEEGFSQKKLVVCLHGLSNGPKQFDSIMRELFRRGPVGMDLFIPPILEAGNAKLDDMVQPIFEQIRKWSQTEGDKELVLVGISNGGRIARALEARLGPLTSIKKIHFISVVGACQGSSLVNWMARLHLSWLVGKNIREEMAVDSPRNQQLNAEWMSSLTTSALKEYTFIASPHDLTVPNYDSTLAAVPSLPGITARYALLPGHGHHSMQEAAAKAVAEIISQQH